MTRTRIIFTLLGTSCALCTMIGCETLGEELSSLGTMFNPTTPSEAARDMVVPHDADRRRTGTVLISSAHFGGVETYVTLYRDMVVNEFNPLVRAAAIRALSRHGDSDDALRIMPNLSHENVQVRWEAAKALQRIHNPAVVPDLLKTLLNEAEDQDVRVAAATALGQYEGDRVFQGLVAALDARELAINTAAKKSLQTITGQSFDMDAAIWLDWYNKAASTGNAFTHRREYVYPTYSREETFWEQMAIWTTRTFEEPGPPIGLRPSTERRTYDEKGDLETQ